MGMKKAIIDPKAKTLTVVLDLEAPTLSKSGKTYVVASTHGNQKTGQEIDGHEIVVGVNAYIPIS